MASKSHPDEIRTWQMIEPGRLELASIPMPELGEDETLVKIAGCGVCHTDLGYFYHGVPTKTPPPLTLGHEISGTVVDGPKGLIGGSVIIPAVLPCGECEICQMGRGNRCLKQKMPGNSMGIYGGFSDYIVVPTYDLCLIVDLKDIPLSHYAVIADAVTTPYQAAMRAELKEGDLVVVVGCHGGVGTYMTQMAKTLGAKVVIGIDVSDEKLERMKSYGADFVINSNGRDPKFVKDGFKAICKEAGVPSNYGWKIFEASGVKAGQEIALALHSFIGILIVIGFSNKKVEYMLSMEMVRDSDILGTWGCKPKHYPTVLGLVQSGKIQIEPFLELRPMSKIVDVFEHQFRIGYDKRQVLVPDF